LGGVNGHHDIYFRDASVRTRGSWVSFLDRSAEPIGGISERQPKPTEIDLNFKFPTLRTYFEDEVASSTPSVIHQWKALVKLEFWTPLNRTAEEYLNLDTRSTEILVPKQEYQSPKSCGNIQPIPADMRLSLLIVYF